MTVKESNSTESESLIWTKELVADFWDGMERAGVVDANSFGRMAKRCIYWVISKHLKEGGQHLDYGSGGGEVAAYLTEKGFPFAVFEPSEERQKKTAARLSSLPGFLGEAPTIPEKSYDVVTCFEVLEHVLDDELENVLDTLSGHVKKGGKIIISTPNNEDLTHDTVYCPVSKKYFHRWQHLRQVNVKWLTAKFECRDFETLCTHQLDFNEALFSPYLHHMNVNLEGFTGTRETPLPVHVDRVMRDVDGTMGGATRLLYIATKTA